MPTLLAIHQEGFENMSGAKSFAQAFTSRRQIIRKHVRLSGEGRTPWTAA